MNRWHEDLDELSDSGVFDPLCVKRSAPMDDEEAALIETLCQGATPEQWKQQREFLLARIRTLETALGCQEIGAHQPDSLRPKPK